MIFLVRHADAQWVDPISDTIVGDPALSKTGVAQLDHLRRHLATLSLDDFAHSRQRRVVETLEGIAPCLASEPVGQDWLREITYPAWAGSDPKRVFEQLHELDAADPAARWEGLAGGENQRSYTRMVRRGALRFLRDRGIERGTRAGLWRVADPTNRIGVLGHAGSLTAMLGLLLGLPPTPWDRQRWSMRQASVTVLTEIAVGSEFAFALESLGRDDFLPDKLRSPP